MNSQQENKLQNPEKDKAAEKKSVRFHCPETNKHFVAIHLNVEKLLLRQHKSNAEWDFFFV